MHLFNFFGFFKQCGTKQCKILFAADRLYELGENCPLSLF